MQGIELRQARESAGVSQERLAEVMGVGRSYISQIENRVRLTDRLRDRYSDALARLEEDEARRRHGRGPAEGASYRAEMRDAGRGHLLR